MDTLLRTSVFLWISGGSLFLPAKSEDCSRRGFSARCDVVYRDVCLEFVEELKTWSQARSSCGKRGGELLRELNGSIKVLLRNITEQRNTSNFTWWLGEDKQEEHDGNNGVSAVNKCTFMKLNPLQLIVTSDCSRRRGLLCVHRLQQSSNAVNRLESSHESTARLKRAAHPMASAVSDIHLLLRRADEELQRMETTVGEPTNDSRNQFTEYLLEGTKRLSPIFAVQNNATISHIINCSTGIFLLSMKRCDILTNPSPTAFFEQVYEIYRTIASLMGSVITEQFVIRHRTGTIYQGSYKSEDIGHAVLGSEEDGEYVKLPSYRTLETHVKKFPKIYTQMATFIRNPHPSEEDITGTICSILLSNGDSDIELQNLTERIEIFMSREGAATPMKSAITLEENTNALTKVNVTDANMTIVFDVEPNVNVSLVLKLSRGTPPNSTYHLRRTILDPAGPYRWMITPEMLEQTPGTWYIEAGLFNATWRPGLTLNISTFLTKCIYWDIDREIWATNGCMVGEKSTPERTQCLCNHLTLFGSSFFVMPNYVDLSRTVELFATVNDNYVVLALLCAFFGLYLVTLLWAGYSDRRARSKRKMTLLEDNHPGAQYNYLISVQTGHRKNAGTTANVTVKLMGTEGESETHTLTDPDKPVFERGAVDMFLLAAPFPMGEVRNLRLQHDNSGGRPSWYINKVIIQDLQTRHVWHFFCDCWLSSDRGDGMTKKTFNAAKSNEIASFRNIFQTRTSTGFRDEHIWVSIVDPPSRSPFTRAQRVSCCMSLLLCTMAINIAFWNIPIDHNSAVLFSLGSLEITWQELMVGVQSGLLMFPINILIITIFRSIKPRMVPNSNKDDCEEKWRPDAITVPSILKDAEEVISLVSKSPRNKMSEMSRLETTADLDLSLDRVHEFIQLMQGESESDPHWVYCSKFLLAGLCHLLMCLEQLDAKHFPTPEEYQHVLNLTNVLVRKAEMVFSSHLAYCPPPVKKKRRRSGGCWLPWWCVFLGWFLLLSISAVSTYFTLLYGFQYGRDKSIKWVMSLGLSLFQSIFILQPLKVIGIAVFFALLLRPVSVEETDEIEQLLLEQQDRCRRYSGRHTL